MNKATPRGHVFYHLCSEHGQQISCRGSVWSACARVMIMMLRTCTLRLLIGRKSRLPSTATSTTAVLRCSDLLSSVPPSSALAHDKGVIDSETDTLGCFLAAYQQRSLGSSFRSLSCLMKDGRWNSMAVITAVAPILPLDLVRDHTALSVPHQQWDQVSTMLIQYARAVSYFWTFVPSQWNLCVLVHDMYQPHL